jgi:hypothetical protein
LASGGGLESPPGLFFPESVDVHDLPASTSAPDDTNRISLDAERVREERHERGVRAAALGRRCDAHLPALSMTPHDLVASCPRRDDYE